DEYGLIKYQDGVQVFERGYDGPVSGITQPEPSPRVYDAADLAIDTGEYENGRIVSTNGSEGDYIWFGPYDTLTTGNYTATFRVNVSGTGSEPVVMVGVAGGQDHARIASKQVTPKNGWQNVTVPFTLDETTREIELRGIRQGEGRIALDSVRVAYGSNTTEANATTTARRGVVES